MTYFITGASGFVGSHCREALGCESPAVDVCNTEGLAATIAAMRPTHVIHLAAQSHVAESFKSPRSTYDVNFLGTLNLLEALERADFSGRLLFVGTADAYGSVPEEDLPVAETRALRPRNPYAVSKTAAEALCYQWSQSEGLDIVMVRPFNHIGPRQAPSFAVSDFARQIARIKLGKQPPKLITGDLDVTRDFTDVRDVVKAYRQLLEKGTTGEVYNVCSGRETSLRSIVDELQEIASVSVALVRDPTRMRPSEQRRVRGSCKKIYEATGWIPAIELRKSLEDMLNHWLKEENA